MKARVKILPHLHYMTDSSQFNISLSPYLDNSTRWWVENFCPSLDMNRSQQNQEKLKMRYHQWMSDQGVVIKNIEDTDYQINESRLYFVDEQSMLMFALRWGN